MKYRMHLIYRVLRWVILVNESESKIRQYKFIVNRLFYEIFNLDQDYGRKLIVTNKSRMN